MKVNTNPIRGTYDYAPKQAELREEVRQTILRCYQNNGFSLINTPILENLELLNSSDGGDNLKLMFKTVKRGDKLDLSKLNLTEKDIVEEGLRYDLTVPLARFYANNKESLPNPFKAIQIDYSFRAERPQKGRDRQFTQCDIDEFGDAGVEAEIDVLSTGLSAYKKLGFENLTVKINSREILNCLLKNCGFDESEFNTVCVSLDKLDKIGVDGVLEELNVKCCSEQYSNYGKENRLLNAITEIKRLGVKALYNYGISDELIGRVKTITGIINKMFKRSKIRCEFDITVIRGQGYYTGVVFEVYSKEFSGAIGGGGRYDKMIEKLIGIHVPAVGFSIGFARVCMLLDEKNKRLSTRKKVAIIYDGYDFEKVFLMKKKLMRKFGDISLYKDVKNMKNLLDKLKNSNFTHYAFFRKDIKEIELREI